MSILLALNSNFINGELKKSFSGAFTVKSPFTPYSFELPNSSSVDMSFALSCATKARERVASLSFDERCAILARAAELYAVDDDEMHHIAQMTGMPIKYVRERVNFGKSILSSIPAMLRLRYGHKFDTITRELLKNGSDVLRVTGYETHRAADGIIAAFVPPNDPAEIPFLFGHIVMYGGVAIIKPSATEPYFSMKIAKLLTDAGYPAGALSVIHWDTSDATRNSVRAELVKCSSHRIIMGGKKTADMLLKVTDDDGNFVEEHYSTGRNCIFSSGNSKAIVAEGCDVELVAELLVKGAYEWTRDCVTTKTAFVVGEQKHRLIHAVKKLLEEKSSRMGSILDEHTEIGSVEDAQRVVQTITGLIDFKYATLHFGTLECRGNSYTPFLLETSQLHSPLLQQELPYTLTIVPVATFDDAIAAVNIASQNLDDGMSMAVSVFSPHLTLDDFYRAMPESTKKLLTMKCHMLMYNKPSTMLNVYLRHQDMLLTEFLTHPLSINHD